MITCLVNKSWVLVDACSSFVFLNHELGEAQEALEVGQIYKFGFDLLEEVGHTTKCCHFGSMKFFWANFFRSLIRACTGRFSNVYPAFYTKDIEVGQIFGLSKNGS